MTLATQIALTSTPLAAYFGAIGLLHRGGRPRMIAGPFDVGLLALGLGGLVGFGPIGQAVIGRLAGPSAGLLPWSIWVGVLLLWAVVFASSAVRRLAVYHVTAEELDEALRQALGQLEGRFERTIRGFEDSKRQTGLTVKVSGPLQAAGIEGYGREPEALIQELGPYLDLALKEKSASVSGTSVSRLMISLAALSFLVPIAGMLLLHLRAVLAFRSLLHSLRWW